MAPTESPKSEVSIFVTTFFFFDFSCFIKTGDRQGNSELGSKVNLSRCKHPGLGVWGLRSPVAWLALRGQRGSSSPRRRRASSYLQPPAPEAAAAAAAAAESPPSPSVPPSPGSLEAATFKPPHWTRRCSRGLDSVDFRSMGCDFPIIFDFDLPIVPVCVFSCLVH